MSPVPGLPTGNRGPRRPVNRGPAQGASGTFAAAVGGPGRFRIAARRALTAALACALALSACGGEEERQDAGEPRGSFPVEVTEVEFPLAQSLADRTTFVVEVRNTGTETIPNIAVTLDGLDRSAKGEDVAADPQRPIWILESGPRGGTTAYVNTWAKGELPAGETARFEWDVTAVKAGTHELTYRVAAGLDGKARAQGEGERAPEGDVTVTITDRPTDARVDPDTGEVILEGGGSPDDRNDPIDPSEESRGGE